MALGIFKKIKDRLTSVENDYWLLKKKIEDLESDLKESKSNLADYKSQVDKLLNGADEISVLLDQYKKTKIEESKDQYKRKLVNKLKEKFADFERLRLIAKAIDVKRNNVFLDKKDFEKKKSAAEKKFAKTKESIYNARMVVRTHKDLSEEDKKEYGKKIDLIEKDVDEDISAFQLFEHEYYKFIKNVSGSDLFKSKNKDFSSGIRITVNMSDEELFAVCDLFKNKKNDLSADLRNAKLFEKEVDGLAQNISDYKAKLDTLIEQHSSNRDALAREIISLRREGESSLDNFKATKEKLVKYVAKIDTAVDNTIKALEYIGESKYESYKKTVNSLSTGDEYLVRLATSIGGLEDLKNIFEDLNNIEFTSKVYLTFLRKYNKDHGIKDAVSIDRQAVSDVISISDIVRRLKNETHVLSPYFVFMDSQIRRDILKANKYRFTKDELKEKGCNILDTDLRYDFYTPKALLTNMSKRIEELVKAYPEK